MGNSKVRDIVLTGMLIAVGIILPMAFHGIPNAGSVFLPMHIPVLICGLALGWQYGLICGIITPILSSFFTGMPPMAILPSMLCELAIYGLVAGIMVNVLSKKNRYANLYVSLLTAMISGRIVMGILNAVIFKAGKYGLQVWMTASFATALPGIVIQIVLIPTIVFALEKAKLINTGHEGI